MFKINISRPMLTMFFMESFYINNHFYSFAFKGLQGRTTEPTCPSASYKQQNIPAFPVSYGFSFSWPLYGLQPCKLRLSAYVPEPFTISRFHTQHSWNSVLRSSLRSILSSFPTDTLKEDIPPLSATPLALPSIATEILKQHINFSLKTSTIEN